MKKNQKERAGGIDGKPFLFGRSAGSQAIVRLIPLTLADAHFPHFRSSVQPHYAFAGRFLCGYVFKIITALQPAPTHEKYCT